MSIASSDPWNTLEIAKLAIGVLTPVSVAILGWLLSRRLRRLDHAHWTNQKLIEKRIEVYDEIAPQLNKLLCFYCWFGDWKNISPEEVIKSKRALDKSVYVYRHIFSKEVFETYQNFINTLFETYTGIGHDAKIRSAVDGINGNRVSDTTYEWDESWRNHFASPESEAPLSEIRSRYQELMNQLTRSLGVEENDT